MRGHDRRRRGLLATLAVLLAVPAAGQYRTAGSDLEVLPPRQQQLDRAASEARWHLGVVRLAPWAGLRDVRYVRELDAQGREQTGDLTATIGAGLRAYLRLGSQGMVAAHALPEYSWWRRQSDRNTPIGRYGLGYFGFFNRLETELTARRTEAIDFLGADTLVLQPTRNDVFAASAQVRLGGAAALYTAASTSRLRVLGDPPAAAPRADELLDSDQRSYRAGLRYLLRGERGYLGAGAHHEESEFLASGRLRSSEGDGWYTEALLRGNRLDLSLAYDHRELAPPSGGSFPGYDGGSGRLLLALRPGWRIRAQLYASSALRYSARDSERYFEEERAGIGLSSAMLGGSLQLFYEQGRNLYFGDRPTTGDEDVTAYGATFDLPIKRLMTRIGARQTELVPDRGPAREVREVIGSLSLTLGSPGGDW